MSTGLTAEQRTLNWQQRLVAIVETMREMSLQTDPQEMVKAYAARMREIFPTDRRISLSRRGLESPNYRITRYTGWDEDINPWKEPERLPLLKGGLLAELIYGDKPRIIDELEISPDEPAYEYLEGQQSLIAVPMFDQGTALNMVVATRTVPNGFDRERFPETVWMSNLFGRATHNLVLAERLEDAYTAVDRELQAVANIQRSLLPSQLPKISTMRLAAHYQTSRRAGGDYYDFFPLPDNRWGILIADVSGHGTPAAVMMAITHVIAHTQPGQATPPSRMLNFLNDQLASRYVGDTGTFVTAFYGIYDANRRHLSYSSAGHNPPRLRRCSDGSIRPLDGTINLPLGVMEGERYAEASFFLSAGDRILFYTDGITEAQSPDSELFGTERLDLALSECSGDPRILLERVLAAVDDFTQGRPATDDRTLLVADVF